MKKLSTFLLAGILFFLLFGFTAVVTHADVNTFIKNIHVVNVDNFGIVNNTVHTTANTGANTTESNGGTNTGGSNSGGASNTVQTGDAGSQSTVSNCVNTTTVNGDTNPCVAAATATPAPMPTATPTPGSGGCTENCGGSSGGPGGNGSSGGGSGSGTSGTTQAVLGTMASTGTFTENMMNILGAMGIGLLLFSSFLTLKDKQLSFELQITR